MPERLLATYCNGSLLSAWPVSGLAATVAFAAPALDEIHVGSGNDAQLSGAPRSYVVARDRIRTSVFRLMRLARFQSAHGIALTVVPGRPSW